MLPLYLDLSEAPKGRYTEALRRIRGVRLVEEIDLARAVITESPPKHGGNRRCLWVPPGEGEISEIGAWDDCDAFDSESVMLAAEWRYRPSVQVVADHCFSGRLGEPGLLRVHRWCREVHLVAELDLACWLFGEAPTSLYAISRPGYLQCHLGFSEGGMALLDLATGMESRDDYESLSLIGAHGAAYADDHRNVNLRYGPAQCEGLRVSDGDTGLVGLLGDFVRCVLESHPFPVTLKAYQSAYQWQERVWASIEKGAVT